jgi:hypothetical protein
MRSSCAKGACKLRIRRLQRRSICLRGGCILPNLVLWPCSGLSASPVASQAVSCLSGEATTLTKMAKRGTATDFQAAIPVRPLPSPTRRARAGSAAIGRFDRVGTAAAAAPVDADAMDTAAIHTTAPLPASAAGTKRARSPSREGGTGDAQGTSAEADAASDSDEPDVCCPGVTRAEVVADPNGGELYASDVVAPPPNQLGGATCGPMYGGARPSTCAVQYKTDKLSDQALQRCRF